jgi:hypothetical protein
MTLDSISALFRWLLSEASNNPCRREAKGKQRNGRSKAKLNEGQNCITPLPRPVRRRDTLIVVERRRWWKAGIDRGLPQITVFGFGFIPFDFGFIHSHHFVDKQISGKN